MRKLLLYNSNTCQAIAATHHYRQWFLNQSSLRSTILVCIATVSIVISFPDQKLRWWKSNRPVRIFLASIESIGEILWRCLQQHVGRTTLVRAKGFNTQDVRGSKVANSVVVMLWYRNSTDATNKLGNETTSLINISLHYNSEWPIRTETYHNNGFLLACTYQPPALCRLMEYLKNS